MSVSDLTLPQRFAELKEALNGELVERREEIDAALLALVSGKTLFMVGDPGIAKSLLARRIQAYIAGGSFFDHDMDKFSTPEDLFGPRDLLAMKEGRWERVIDGTILTANWAMLDEFWEASSAVLKTLLRALNERTYHNGTEIISIPLTTVFCASNTVPTEDRLLPLYDRLIIRRSLRPIQDGSAFGRMLGLQRVEHPQPLLDWADVEQAQAEAMKVTLDDKVVRAVIAIRRALAEVDVRPSDRRFAEAMAVVRAAAWMDGCQEAEVEHLSCLVDICWSDVSQISLVGRTIDRVLEPLVSAVDKLMRDLRTIDSQIRSGLSDLDRQRLAIELHDKLKAADAELKVLAVPAHTWRQKEKVERTRAFKEQVAQRMITELFQGGDDT